MNTAVSWILAIAIALCLIGLVASGRSDRQAYWAHRTAVIIHADMTPQPTPAFPPGFLKR